VDGVLFRADVERLPATLTELARAVTAGEVRWPVPVPLRRILLTGMGSSWFAASVIAHRLRAAGLDAVAELASAERTWPASPDLLVVAVSASGASVETLEAVEHHVGTSAVVALTNVEPSPLGDRAGAVVDMLAGDERGGVACRSFRHTIGALLALEQQLAGTTDVAVVLRRAAAATADLLDRADAWLSPVLDALASVDGTWFIAPVERMSSALQGALMVREGPRRRADACETGDWTHVDVYLTKSLDYRAVVFTGSRHEAAAARWMNERRSTVVAVGGPFPGASLELRYPGDDDPLVALLTEVLVAELVAAAWWAEADPGTGRQRDFS
jgi:glucosamine--fructose-6-phosphate aminotransferase (isomerizing)